VALLVSLIEQQTGLSGDSALAAKRALQLSREPEGDTAGSRGMAVLTMVRSLPVSGDVVGSEDRQPSLRKEGTGMEGVVLAAAALAVLVGFGALVQAVRPRRAGRERGPPMALDTDRGEDDVVRSGSLPGREMARHRLAHQ
jgi:hypothetical protein